MNLLPPGRYFADRINQIDMRFGKILNFGNKRANIAVDVLNLFNANTGTAFQQNYGTGRSYLNPTADPEPAVRPVQRDGGFLRIGEPLKPQCKGAGSFGSLPFLWSKYLDKSVQYTINTFILCGFRV